jgi:hypothetical protein
MDLREPPAPARATGAFSEMALAGRACSTMAPAHGWNEAHEEDAG